MSPRFNASATVSIVWARAAIAADLSLGTPRPHFLSSIRDLPAAAFVLRS
jgi:hypothetical protein